MTYYLKHLFALYVSYMKLGLMGVVVSAFTLPLYAAFKTNNPGSGLAILGGFFGVLIGVISVRRYRRRHKEESEESALRRSEAEAKVKLASSNLRLARHFLKSKKATAEENAAAGVSGKKLVTTHQEGGNKAAR